MNNRKHFQRYISNDIEIDSIKSNYKWMSQITSECAVLDNFYVEKPVYMIDLVQTISVTGVIIVTSQPFQPTGIFLRVKLLLLI